MNGSLSTPDLLGLVNREITPDVIHRTALQLGEDDGSWVGAVDLGAVGADRAFGRGLLGDGGDAPHSHDRGIDANRAGRDSVASILGSATGREQGATLFDGETGERAPKIAEAVARASDIKAESAHKLLGGATGAALLTIGRSAQRLEPEGLRSMLGEQRGESCADCRPRSRRCSTAGARPGRRSPGPSSNRGIVRRAPAIRPLEGAGGRGWLAPVILLGALALIAIRSSGPCGGPSSGWSRSRRRPPRGWRRRRSRSGSPTARR